MSPPALKLRLVQAYRLAVLLGILWLLRAQHEWVAAQRGVPVLAFEEVQGFYSEGARLGAVNPDTGGQVVFDRKEREVGFVIQTSPHSDGIVGYSGPTNTLIAFDEESRIIGAKVLRSGDTPDHLDLVLDDPGFLASYEGRTWEEAGQASDVDGVSGATLTSLAIREGILFRLAGERVNLRFPDSITLEEAREIFPEALRLEPMRGRRESFVVIGAGDRVVGHLLRTGHLADRVQGYKGPTDVLIALDETGETVMTVRIRSSYDTPEYVRDVARDRHYRAKFEGQAVASVADIDLESGEIEGVSGATMTSLAMVESVREALREWRAEAPDSGGGLRFAARDAGLVIVIVLGLLMAFTDLHGRKTLRRVYQVGLIVYLGFISGDMLAQALLLGWTQSGIAWSTAPGLVLLVAASFLVPAATGRQVYCHHICPHGAAQQLLMRWVPKKWRLSLPHALARIGERGLPMLLLFWVLLVGMLGLGFDLAGIEPFDAYIVRAAGIATIAVFVIGLLVSAFVPMAYCRFGCPTGRLLEFVRFRRGGEHFGRREILGGVFLVIAVGLYLGREFFFS